MPTSPNPLGYRTRRTLVLSGVFLLSQAFRLPSPVRDAATLEWAPSFHLELPKLHLLFTPFCSVADYLTLLSAQQAYVMLAWVFVLVYALWGWKKGTILFLFFVGFTAWGALVPRPMGRLVAENSETLLVDFHSHTRASHDGRPSFGPEENMRWHQAQGYGAGFITDHNQITSAEEAAFLSEGNWRETGYRSLIGEEISLWKTHLVVLGSKERIDNLPFDSDPAKVEPFIRAMKAKGFLVIASLPEYWWYHWGEGVQKLIAAGIDGFEIVNSAPKALDFPVSKRLEILDELKRKNLFFTGISDNHGYGYATAVWNAVQVPGWQTMAPGSLEASLLYTLRNDRFNAVQVLERARYLHRNNIELIFSPVFNALYYWRGLGPWQAVSWACWIWLGWAVGLRWQRFNGSKAS